MIPILNSHPHSAPSLASLTSLLKTQLNAINACILEKMQSPVTLIPQIAGYLISLGGKRLRPLLTVASAELCGYEGTRHIQLAACVEFIHTATLLHDDVVDESTLRRGMSTANALWSNKASVLVGDFLFSRAFELMVNDGSLDVLQILSQASSTIAEGEVMQLASSHDLELSQETYLKIIGAKTARLFSAATEVGAVVANADASKRKALAWFGHTLGIAFQLMDDVLDYAADQEKLGKAIGDDFREGKVTLPVILAYEKGADSSFWKEAFEGGVRDEGALAHATRLLRESGSLLKTNHIAQDFVNQALESLKIFPKSHLKEALQDLAYFSLHREV
ncbi:MAG: farnesyltranstransferase [Alphaproteobacteria bacterium 41-28]|nr:MAG: farnesyltranstransferase [Alphaproteobacteria bacterium 41-28]